MSSPPQSLYRATTADLPPFPALRGKESTGIAIVGGGYTGLSAALHLREAGADVMVIEAVDIGHGASGRNGGQVNPGLKSDPSGIVSDFGKERGKRLLALAGSAPTYVFDLIQRHGIACDAVNAGSIRVVVGEADRRIIESSAREWAGLDAPVSQLTPAQLREKTGTAAYTYGLEDRRGGQLNPLAYVRGLAATVAKKGGRIFVGSPAKSLRREGNGWRLDTPEGSVQAGHVVLASNGYTDGLWPRLRETVIPVYSAVAATDPLPAEALSAILPGRQVVYESSSRVLYFRIDHEGRFLMGGPSVLRDRTDSSDYAHLLRHARRLYPQAANWSWRYFWNGQVALTRDHYPHLHEPAPGVIAGLGYNGRGVAMATVMGSIIARRILGAHPDDLELPISPLDPFAFHRFWKIGATFHRISNALKEKTRNAACRMRSGTINQH